MAWTFSEIIGFFSEKKRCRLIQCASHGLEKESLRVTPSGELAKTPYPAGLGSSLHNHLIKTDFSESQLELVTPTFNNFDNLLACLKYIHSFTHENLENSELLWPYSMPARLPDNENDIPIANLGTSAAGLKKMIYRKGLSLRYGRRMQTISGIHYNFSFCPEFWDSLTNRFNGNKSRTDFISAGYFHLIRNFLRHSWLLIYLFGAAPVIDKSYLDKKLDFLEAIGSDSYGGKYATSLRMSAIGYNNVRQPQVKVSYNSVEEHLHDLEAATKTPYAPYSQLGLFKNNEQIQLNDSLLQIENEHYALIRAKRKPKDQENVIQALNRRGVKYVEVRTVDLDPSSPIGINLEQLRFLHLFVTFCLFEDSPPLNQEDLAIIFDNQNKTAIYGRDPKLELKQADGALKPLTVLGQEFLEKMRGLGELLDCERSNHHYQAVIRQQMAKIADPALTPSAKFLTDLKTSNKSLIDFGVSLAIQQNQMILDWPLPDPARRRLQKEARRSLEQGRGSRWVRVVGL